MLNDHDKEVIRAFFGQLAEAVLENFEDGSVDPDAVNVLQEALPHVFFEGLGVEAYVILANKENSNEFWEAAERIGARDAGTSQADDGNRLGVLQALPQVNKKRVQGEVSKHSGADEETPTTEGSGDNAE